MMFVHPQCRLGTTNKIATCGIISTCLVLLAGCFAKAQSASVPVKSDVVGDDCDLSRILEMGTKCSDFGVQSEALRLLGDRGPSTCIDAIGEALADENEMVRLRAIYAAGNMSARQGAPENKIRSLLCRALGDPSLGVQRSALYALASFKDLSPSERESIRALLDDSADDIQIAALSALGNSEVDDHLQARAAMLLRHNSGEGLDSDLSNMLVCFHDPRAVPVVELLLESKKPYVRTRARWTIARLQGDQAVLEESALEAKWTAENQSACESLRREPWQEVSKTRVMQAANKARLILYGEIHEDHGPLRDSQCEVLRAFVNDPAFDAVGFEPSVEGAQRIVLDLARSLGLRVIPLETDWADLVASFRPGARELQTITAIEAFLNESPRNRLFVVRGESHVLPDGYLVRRLTQKPMIVLSGIMDSIPLCQAGLYCGGRAFQAAAIPDLYMLPYDEEDLAPDTARLALWIEQHPAADPSPGRER